MPSAADFNAVGTATTLASNYVIIVQEHLDAAHDPAPLPGNRAVCAPATYTLHYTVKPIPHITTQVVVDIYTGLQPGSAPLYFLPWAQNAATTMTIPAGGAGPAVFMTSMLSGCTVQVFGPATSPTVTHANARDTYFDGYKRMSDWLDGIDITAQQRHDGAEARANTIATGKINQMLPDPAGANTGYVRKADYAGKVTAGNLLTAQRRFINSLPGNESVGSYDVSKMALKPKTGAFVYGLRDAANNWSFWYQAAVDVDIVVQDKFGGG